MSVTQETIHKIAHLARLEFNEQESAAFTQDFNKILDWMNKLNEVNTDQVTPLIHMSEEVNVLRDDIVHNALEQDVALSLAPKKDSDYFRVPKFLG